MIAIYYRNQSGEIECFSAADRNKTKAEVEADAAAFNAKYVSLTAFVEEIEEGSFMDYLFTRAMSDSCTRAARREAIAMVEDALRQMKQEAQA